MAKDPKKRGLGMGLDALFANSAPVSLERKTPGEAPIPGEAQGESAPENAVIYIDINDIKPNEHQPRKVFDDEKIQELADSILEHGIIQPLILRPAASGYEIVAGERRYRAARKAGLKEVPSLVRELTDQENMLIAIIENMQREDLNPVEEAEGLEQMIRTYGLTQEEVSRSVGKSRPYIANSLRLLNLNPKIREMLANGEITSGHARALLSITDEKRQLSLAQDIVKKGLTVRDIEKLTSAQSPRRRSVAKKAKSQDAKWVEEELKTLLGTKVNLIEKGKRGKLEIEYYSLDELNRLIDLLRTVKK